MNAILDIEIDDQKVKYLKTPPKILSNNLFHSAEMWGVSDSRVDILVQRRAALDNAFWKYSFLVHQKVKLHFHQPVQSMFMFFNLGVELKMKLGNQDPVLFRCAEGNLFYMPEFLMTAYPDPNKKRFELFLMDVGKGDNHSVMRVLSEVAMLNEQAN